ncbi:hypothetical protein FOPG_12141 [Fusarium oxysporum f. sp. conglutinans race 2 54008]|uniref:MEI5 protein n=2 Tax=Fusarium oxysporum f. sp. conglutinans TaxID=100902 RepID=A0A8H6H302_FUSOX|nr:hypothetical protein FOPG_12141 [Fusarium oxysporum f. sp. conglutinans race 2 54008]KAF6528804.1 hypothetical protein HZS61_000116 [Fusarium oxysporum f. sp. conglutinans]KAG6991833.1 hypothetical protein FocnCong_v019517 [Fusarium oxysporum f. sp. conglutinans]KAI8419526.1 hypothetical protein FOFC_02115 [Fusarium oxysporum]
MPSHNEKRVQEVKDLSPHQDTSDAINQLVTLLHQYCSEGGFDTLKGVVGENEELKRDKARLQTAYDTNIEALSRHKTEFERQKVDFEKQIGSQKAQNEAILKAKQAADESIKKRQAELTALQEKLEMQSSSAKQLMNEIKKKESMINALEATNASQQENLTKAEKESATFQSAKESMQKRVNGLTTSLDEVRGRLTTFHSFVVKLDNFEARRGEVGDALDSILRNALSFVESSIGIALDEACLTDIAVWGRLRNHASIQRTIPLPASNSPAAKQMRVAAGLRIYSMALADHVFKSTYLTQNSDFEDVLRDLETEDPLHEAFTRAVLLKIQPARQTRNREARAKMVADQVSDAIADLVPPSQKETLKARLYQVSLEACNAWLVIQQLLEPVRPVFSLHMPEDWVPLPSSVPQRNSKAGLSGVAREPLATRVENQGQEIQQPNAESQPIEIDDIMQVIWPAFYVTSSQQEDDVGDQVPELVHRGHVITRSQGREAEIEMSRRNARKNARQNSGSSPTQRKRRDSAVFLSKTFPGGIGTEKGN